MALFDKVDFEGVHAIDSAAKVEWILQNTNNKGNQHFNAMAQFGDGAAAPLDKADMIQTYTLDAAGVETVLQAGGLRGHKFLTNVTLLGIVPAAGAIEVGPAASVNFDMNGLWSSPTALNIGIDADAGTNLSTSVAFSDDYLRPEAAAEAVAGAINAIGASMVATAAGNLVTVSAQTPATTLVITALALA